MRLKFKTQAYQTAAVESVVDCFQGQPLSAGVRYRMDPGKETQLIDFDGFKNADLQLAPGEVLANIQDVQRRQQLPTSKELVTSARCKYNLDVEMETGTGKTYCYIKSMFEMHKRYGWNKFIVVVPSIAIREGVYKSLEITADHFSDHYGKRARFFIYNSQQLHQLESFSSDAGINVMVINIQAFNATGKDNRRIYEELDDFQSRKPIDVISSNRPILILDEPQKMEGKKTLTALEKFKPLMILRYSATHRTEHNRIHRLDALDAYNQKLVKKINVRGIAVKGLAGTNAYLYLERIETSKQAPVARVEIEQRSGSGIKRVVRKLKKGDNLFELSGELDQYREGFVISQIDANVDEVEFTNGLILTLGQATQDITEETFRQIQIRETIMAHLEKERILFDRGIKVLSLFFIDEVAKYRDYNQEDDQGEYARMFEREYTRLVEEYLSEIPLGDEAYRAYLKGIEVEKTHNGYFSIDKKSKQLKDPKVAKRGENAGLSDDVDAYDLILKDKERLLSFEEPVRFIFSHSALREGWDNPNVFTMCMLKHSDNSISRRQEVGRGLRLSVNRDGDRMDHPALVHEINVLTVVASESYKDFVSGLQKEISETLGSRPRKADEAYFTGKLIPTKEGETLEISPTMASQLFFYLVQHQYVDYEKEITPVYHEDKANDRIASLPPDLEPHREGILALIDSVFSKEALPEIGDDRKPKTNPLNANFERKEFQALWSRINHKAIYRVEFESGELVTNCIRTLNQKLRVAKLQYQVERGEQKTEASFGELTGGHSFTKEDSRTETLGDSVRSVVKYDLLGKLSEGTALTRKTIAEILTGTERSVFEQFRYNPEHFITEANRLIQEQKASVIIEKLTYNQLNACYDADIFTAAQTRQDMSKAVAGLKNHVYDYAVVDSKVEGEFVQELDTSSEVVVYAKLPKGFLIPTPVGDYNPDWAISFKEGAVKYVYFIAETKGDMSTLSLRGLEERKIECARRYFEELNAKIAPENVRYDVVDSYGKLMDVVGATGEDGEKNA